MVLMVLHGVYLQTAQIRSFLKAVLCYSFENLGQFDVHFDSLGDINGVSSRNDQSSSFTIYFYST